MLVNFDIDKLNLILADFHRLTGVTVSVFNANHTQLTFWPKTMPDFCLMMKNSPKGNNACNESDKEACLKCGILKKPYTFTCHAGLIDTAVPIIYDNKILGYMMFGQVIDKDSDIDEAFSIVKERCEKYNFDEADLKNFFYSLKRKSGEELMSAANILQACASYLWLSQMIDIEQNVLANEIDSFITLNIKEPLPIERITLEFNISKNKLYLLSNTYFNDTIARYITKKRIAAAKKLLIDTDYLISEISEKVGFSDYNYFIKVFKKETGLTPLKYKRLYPLISL